MFQPTLNWALPCCGLDALKFEGKRSVQVDHCPAFEIRFVALKPSEVGDADRLWQCPRSHFFRIWAAAGRFRRELNRYRYVFIQSVQDQEMVVHIKATDIGPKDDLPT